MTLKPRSLPRIDLSYMPPADALAAAMDGFDNTINMLFCARRADDRVRFGAVLKRDDLPAYLGFAIAIEEAGHDIPKQLSILLRGGVQDQDVNLVTGLMRLWRSRRGGRSTSRLIRSGVPPSLCQPLRQR